MIYILPHRQLLLFYYNKLPLTQTQKRKKNDFQTQKCFYFPELNPLWKKILFKLKKKMQKCFLSLKSEFKVI